MQATANSVRAFPRPATVDSTRAFLHEGYEWISNRCRELDVDAFEARLFGANVVCMRGVEAARLFYGGGNFTRVGALPPTSLRLLQGKKSVNRLDGAAHRWRKSMLMSLMTPASVEALVDKVDDVWRQSTALWAKMPRVVLHDAVAAVLCRAVCTWMGIPPGEDLEKRTRELNAAVDVAASFDLRVVGALYLRARLDRWAERMIAEVRAGRIILDASTPLVVIAEHRDESGERLPKDVAASELVNILRPVVAISRYVVFAALALHEHPQARHAVSSGTDADREHFANEVRRFYPFVPAVGGRALRTLLFAGQPIEKGTVVLFDVHGTNHDARIWPVPYELRPERFAARERGPFELVAQGGGDALTDHRCAGDALTLEVMKHVSWLLTSAMAYAIPPQDLTIPLDQIPTLPRSGFVVYNVRPKSRDHASV